MATGGQASEESCPILETGRERQPFYQQNCGIGSNGVNQSMLNGGEAISQEESSIQEAATCQLVNGQQQQPSYLPSAQANGLSYPTQETDMDIRQRQDRQETVPLAEREPDEHEDLPPCHQQLNGAGINGLSSTGEREQAVEHTCSLQELQLWRQESDRQADVTFTAFLLEIKYRVKYVISFDWRQQSLFLKLLLYIEYYIILKKIVNYD